MKYRCLFLGAFIAMLSISTDVALGAEFRYSNPKVKGYALDYCRSWSQACGAPAADAFCRKLGHDKVTRFSVRLDAPPTRVISGEQICRGRSCDRISAVVCEGGRPRVDDKGDYLGDVRDSELEFSSVSGPDDCE